MSQTTILVSTRQIGPKIGMIALQGAISALAEDPLMDSLAQVNRPAIRAIVLNFTNVTSIDKNGIRLIIAIIIHLKHSNIKIVVCGLNEHYRHNFRLMHLDDVINICESEAEALSLGHLLLGEGASSSRS